MENQFEDKSVKFNVVKRIRGSEVWYVIEGAVLEVIDHTFTTEGYEEAIDHHNLAKVPEIVIQCVNGKSGRVYSDGCSDWTKKKIYLKCQTAGETRLLVG